jgi:hypothetical protein
MNKGFSKSVKMCIFTLNSKNESKKRKAMLEKIRSNSTKAVGLVSSSGKNPASRILSKLE